jgi:uncharacterized protein (DUF1330 family)
VAYDLLNLLRFKETADYSRAPELAPAAPISGAAAYDRYLDHVLPFVMSAGGQLLYKATGAGWLLGPEDERWDLVLVVRHTSEQAFQGLMSDAAYHAGMGHRTAALVDGRAMVLTPCP